MDSLQDSLEEADGILGAFEKDMELLDAYLPCAALLQLFVVETLSVVDAYTSCTASAVQVSYWEVLQASFQVHHFQPSYTGQPLLSCALH